MRPIDILFEALNAPFDADFKYKLKPELQRRLLEFSAMDWAELSQKCFAESKDWQLRLCAVLSPAKHGQNATDLLLTFIQKDSATFLIPCVERIVAQPNLPEETHQYLIENLKSASEKPNERNQNAYRHFLIEQLQSREQFKSITLAAEYSIYNADQIAESKQAACYYCQTVFATEEISEYTDDGQTALCPYCGIDAVLPSSAGFSFSEAGILALYEYWFS